MKDRVFPKKIEKEKKIKKQNPSLVRLAEKKSTKLCYENRREIVKNSPTGDIKFFNSSIISSINAKPK